jgi:hypothetical protein
MFKMEFVELGAILRHLTLFFFFGMMRSFGEFG